MPSSCSWHPARSTWFKPIFSPHSLSLCCTQTQSLFHVYCSCCGRIITAATAASLLLQSSGRLWGHRVLQGQYLFTSLFASLADCHILEIPNRLGLLWRVPKCISRDSNDFKSVDELLVLKIGPKMHHFAISVWFPTLRCLRNMSRELSVS